MLFILPVLLSTFPGISKAQFFDPYISAAYYGGTAATLYGGLYNPALYNAGGIYGGNQNPLLNTMPFDYNGMNSFGNNFGGQFNPLTMGTSINPSGLMFNTGLSMDGFNSASNINRLQAGSAYGRRKHVREGNYYGGRMPSLYTGNDCNYSRKGCRNDIIN